jgi:hypothetical protein
MSRVRALVLLASLVLSADCVFANTITRADLEDLHRVHGSSLKLAADIWKYMTEVRPPADRFGCLSSLTDPVIDRFSENIKILEPLVLLASKMVDETDEKAVLRILSVEARSFLESLEARRRGTSSVMSQCAQDTVVASRGQELFRIFDRAALIVHSILKKITKPPE